MAQDPYKGVDPELFLSERIRLHREHRGATAPDPARKLQFAWRTLAEKLNAHLADGLDAIGRDRMYEYGLEVGGGKSTGLALYCAMIAGMARTPEGCPGVLIVSERIADCDQFVNEVNRLAVDWYGATGQFAQAWHSEIDRTRFKLGMMKEFPFLATTQKGLAINLIHEDIQGMYRKNLVGLLDYAYGVAGSIVPLDGFRRSAIVFDEALDPYASFHTNRRAIEAIVEGLPLDLLRKHEDIIDGIELLSVEMSKQARMIDADESLRGQNMVQANLDRWRRRNPSVVPLINALRNYKPADGRAGDGFLKYWNILEKLVDVYHMQVADPMFYRHESEYASKSFQRSVFILDRLERGPFIMDATCKNSHLFDGYSPRETVKMGPTRDYSNFTIEVDRTVGTSRGKLVGKLRSGGGLKRKGAPQHTDYTNADKTADMIRAELKTIRQPEATKVGVIAHTQVIEALKSKAVSLRYAGSSSPLGVPVYGNVGGVRGSNAFRDCDLLYIVGLNHRSYAYAQELKHGFDCRVDELESVEKFDPGYHKAQRVLEDISFPDDPMDAYYGELARDTIQTIGRGMNRVVGPETDQGLSSCPKSTVRICLGDNPRVHQVLMKAITEAFPGAKIVEPGWMLDKSTCMDAVEADALAKELKANCSMSYAEKVLRFFHESKNHEQAIYDIVLDGFKDTKAAAKDVKRKLVSRPSARTRDVMEELGIEVLKRTGIRNNPVWFLVKSKGLLMK